MATLARVQQEAVRLFADRGFAATGIRDISRAVALNSATLYHYAGGKEELLAGVMRACLEDLLRSGREALAHSADPAVRLARLVRAHVAAGAVNPLTSLVTDREVRALTEPNRTNIVRIRDDYESMYQQVLQRGARTGQFQITDVRVARLALVEMCNGVAHWYRPGGRLTVGQVQDRFVELTSRLVGSRTIDPMEYLPDVSVARLASEPPIAPEDREATIQ